MRRIALCLCLALAPVAAWAAPPFTLASPTLEAGGRMPKVDVYTQCGGGNQSPPIRWQHPPADTKSYAVTMFDRSVKGGFWHWIAFDIAGGVHGLQAGAGAPRGQNAPSGIVELRNDFGNQGYSGPCPPAGKPHHYVITVYALDASGLGATARANRRDALAAIRRHTLGKATLEVTWGR